MTSRDQYEYTITVSQALQNKPFALIMPNGGQMNNITVTPTTTGCKVKMSVGQDYGALKEFYFAIMGQ